MQNTGVQVGTSKKLKNCLVFLKTCGLNVEYTGNNCDIWTLLKMSDGNISWGIPSLAATYTNNRDKLDDVTGAPEQPMDFSMDGKYTDALSVNDETYAPPEIVTGFNFASGNSRAYLFAGTREDWLTVNGCPPYAFEIEIHDNPLLECPSSSAYGEITLIRYARVENPQFNLSGGTFTMSGKAHVIRPIIRRIGPDGWTNYSVPEDAEGWSEQYAAPFTDWELDSRMVVAQ